MVCIEFIKKILRKIIMAVMPRKLKEQGKLFSQFPLEKPQCARLSQDFCLLLVQATKLSLTCTEICTK